MRTARWLGLLLMIAVGLAGCAVYDVPGPDPYAGPYAYAPYYGGGYPYGLYDDPFGPMIYPSFGVWGGYGWHHGGWHHGGWHHGGWSHGGGHFGGGHHGGH